MGSGGLLPNCLFSYAKWIALAAALLLVCASLDKVPDCPQVLTLKSGPAAPAPLAAQDSARVEEFFFVPAAAAATSFFRQAPQDCRLPATVPQARYQASDSSPPLA